MSKEKDIEHMEGGITLRCNDEGVWEKYEPYATIDCPTEEDYNFLVNAVEEYKAKNRKQTEGEWKKVYQNKIATVYECSNCGHLTFGTSDYCICGAKMKDASDRVVKFPAECSKKNCSHFKHWESGIAEITCRCDLCDLDADADCEISLECPLLAKGGE